MPSLDDKRAILFVNRVSFFGGAERVLLQCMEVASAAGYTPVLACPADGRLPDLCREAGFPVVPCAFDRMKRSKNPLTLARYLATLVIRSREVERICRASNIALIHAHGPVAAMYALRAARRFGLPMVVHMHDALPPAGAYRLATRYAATVATRFLTVSRAVQRRLKDMGIPGDDTEVVYNGVDRGFLGERPVPVPHVTGPGPHIGIFGQILPLKGQHIFLEAAAIVAGHLPGARFYVVGGMPYEEDQSYADLLTSLSATPALKGKVRFPGYQSNVAEWMAGMDVVALCSVEEEALGLVLLEAMALGRRVVSAEIGGTPEVIEDGVTGRLVPPNDAQALAAAMLELVALPEEHPMGPNAAEAVRNRFSPKQFEDKMRRVYREMLGEAVMVV